MAKAKRMAAGAHFMMGNLALVEGALAAGCNFMAGYPITPASEIPNRLSLLLPTTGGTFLQTEDEIAAICATIGASWGGCKAMTATSGPGLSLMQENLGLACATETPLVIADIQRLGPSTGAPSVGVTGDIVQAARGSHGDYQIVAVAPSTAQEMFDYTIWAFNLSETYRVPVFILSDGFLGHMKESVVIPADSEIKRVERKLAEPNTSPLERNDFLDTGVAPMPVFGRGCQSHVTSSCHDSHGMRNLSDPTAMHDYVTKPVEKILSHREEISKAEADYQEGDIVLVSYGTTSRSAAAAAAQAKKQGLKVGTLRLCTIWPLPDAQIIEAAKEAKKILVLENNLGQLFPYIKAEAASSCPVEFLGPKLVGQIHDPAYVLAKIKEMGS